MAISSSFALLLILFLFNSILCQSIDENHDKMSNFTVIFIAAIVFIVISVIAVILCIYLRERIANVFRRQKVDPQNTSSPSNRYLLDVSSEDHPLHVSIDHISSNTSSSSSIKADQEFSSEHRRSFTTSNSIEEDINQNHVKFINQRSVYALPNVSKDSVKKISRSVKCPKTLPGTLLVDSTCSPTITTICTYSTSDEITILEELRQTIKKPAFPFLRSDGVPQTDERHIFKEMIKNGPRQFPFTPEQITNVLKKGKELFKTEPTLLESPVPCTIYGDIHGQYSDLLRWLNLNGFPNQTRCVFLGDFVDRGPHGVEVVMLITCMKLIWPSNVFVCRGNHEEEQLNKNYSFYDEVACRYGTSKNGKECPIFTLFSDLFSHIPLAVLVGGQILGMHGGISPKLMSLQSIRDIKRPIVEFENNTLACDLVWSDPATASKKELRGFKPNLDREPQSGIGQLFGTDAVKDICDRIGVKLIIRGHQAPLHGYSLFADNRLLTLFSAPGYKGKNAATTNMGASLIVSETLEITINQIEVSENYRNLRVRDLEKRKNEATVRAGIQMK